MMTKMKKMNVLNYQVTHFARDNKIELNSPGSRGELPPPPIRTIRPEMENNVFSYLFFVTQSYSKVKHSALLLSERILLLLFILLEIKWFLSSY